jgi:fimbrial chaperone protein
MKSFLLVIATIVTVQLVAERSSAAYQLLPISRVFAPSGSQATQSFELVNTGTERVALSISFASLERDLAYVEITHDADDEFLAYPAQLVLAPKARQTVRVTWLGNPSPKVELAYRIIVTQVPIELVDRAVKSEVQASGKVRIMLSYRGTLFIRPPGAAPKVALAGAEPVTDARGKTELALTLANTGTAAGTVQSCAVRIAPAAGGAALAPGLASLLKTRILGGSKRRYLVAWPGGLPPGPVKATGQCTIAP